MTYNFDPERWYENELAFITARYRAGKMTEQEFNQGVGRSRVKGPRRDRKEAWLSRTHTRRVGHETGIHAIQTDRPEIPPR